MLLLQRRLDAGELTLDLGDQRHWIVVVHQMHLLIGAVANAFEPGDTVGLVLLQALEIPALGIFADQFFRRRRSWRGSL